jgi:hypothetical protein
MSEQGSTDSKAKRGGGFPSLPLKDAVDAVVTAGLNGPDHTVDAFATYIGHATANSGAFRAKLASLRDWGLITRRGDKDRVALTPLAQELVLAYPDHYEAKQLLLQAFESCRAFGMLYHDSAKNHAIEAARLRTTVLMRYGVATNQADKFVDSFVQSAVFAGLANANGTAVTLVSRETAFPEQGAGAVEAAEGAPPDAVVTAPRATATVAAIAPEVAVAPRTPVALRQQWPIDGGEIEFVIRTSEALPPGIYALVAEMAEVAEKMRVKLTDDVAIPRNYVDPDNEG